MKIDSKARIAIDAILDIAVHGTDRPVRLADISARLGMSKSYLEHLFSMLMHRGFLASLIGPGGGYRLNCRLAEVSVADVVGAVDTADRGHDTRRAAVRKSGDESVITAELWRGLDDHLHDYLRTVSLASLLAGVVETTDRRERDASLIRVPQVQGDGHARNRPQSPASPLSAP